MYDASDPYIQKLIRNGIKELKEALRESTDKQQTSADILKEFKKELFNPDELYWGELWLM